MESYPDSIVIVSPTDHYINDGHAFITHTLRAANLVSLMPDKIAILGIVPDRPDPDYGYILPDKSIDNTKEAYLVKAFTEKPSVFTAREIIDRGGLWNTFVMVFKLSRMLDLLREFVPKEFGKLTALRKSPEKAEEVYRNLSPWNFSNLLLFQTTGICQFVMKQFFRFRKLQVPLLSQVRALSKHPNNMRCCL